MFFTFLTFICDRSPKFLLFFTEILRYLLFLENMT